MPHLQFETNFPADAGEKKRFAGAVVRRFSEIMDTGTDHIGITIRTFAHGDMTFGRAEEADGRIVFMNADIRLGRTRDQKRRLALAVMDEIEKAWGIPQRSVYVIYTEHDGEHFQLSDRVLPSWTAGEDPLADPPAASKGASRPAPARPGKQAKRGKQARKPARRRAR
jgi:phenylpyruvate tautomerase PptA (4-oxalocrotonate tautomerase family)